MKDHTRFLTDRYFSWLTDLIDLEEGKEFTKLVVCLHNLPFYSVVPMDENRAEDGKALRIDFIRDTFTKVDDIWLHDECTVLEMLIALARRISIDIMPDYGMDTAGWFWIFIHNLGWDWYDNKHFNREEVKEKVGLFLDRKYGKDGENQLFFSSRKTTNLLKKTEIWYQMFIWLEENYEF